MRLLVTTYLTDRLPPAQLVSSVRAVVTIGRQIVMLRNPDAAHFLPGGRLEVGESYLQALRREVTEETGLNIRGAKQIGFLHLHHLTPEPTVYRCPYPDMIHLVYAAEGSGTLRSGDADGWVTHAALVAPADARRLATSAQAVPFLDYLFGAEGAEAPLG